MKNSAPQQRNSVKHDSVQRDSVKQGSVKHGSLKHGHVKHRAIIKTPYQSYRAGRLARGCAMCVKGEKLVLFIGGICNRACFYCPLSDQKRQKDVIFANEWQAGKAGTRLTSAQRRIIAEEVRLCEALGAGITGGDPLLVNERTVDAIRFLKEAFGRKFHIHLYTTLENITEKKLKALYAAGLDEIRLHPIIWNDRLWHKMALVTKYDWDVGVEIPSIPGHEEEILRLMAFLDGKISFFNLNELEISDTNANRLVEKGYVPKDRTSYGVAGSDALAQKLMRRAIKEGYHYAIHYCTCALKDSVQMAERLKRRSKNARLPTDNVSGEGMLIRGAVYLTSLAPRYGYRKRLARLTPRDREQALARLRSLRTTLEALLSATVTVDEGKCRLLSSAAAIRKGKDRIKKIGLLPAIVQEYPTSDALEIEVEFL